MAIPDQLARLLELVLTPSPTVFVVGLLVIVLVPVLVHFLLVRATEYTLLPTVLVAGPCLAGKTALVTFLERGPALGPAPSRTSLAPLVVELTASVAEFSDENVGKEAASSADADCTKFLIVDSPGHGKLRAQTLARLEAKAIKDHRLKAVVFVVDAAALLEAQALRDAGECLHSVLLALQRGVQVPGRSRDAVRVPVLVAANKGDLFSALPPAAVQAALETELTRIRASRSKALLDSGVRDEPSVDESDAWLGEYGSKAFTFAQMQEFGIHLDVLGGSTTQHPGASQWWRWICERVSGQERS